LLGDAVVTGVSVGMLSIIVPSATTGQVWREWLTAVGTVGATAAAVYVGVLRVWRRAPKLSLEPSEDDAPSDRRIVGRPDGRLAFVRARVVASGHRHAAESVEVMILDSREIRARPGARPESSLRLEGTLLKWGNVLSTQLTIPPGIHRYIDLVRIRHSAVKEGGAPAEVVVLNPLGDHRERIMSAEFELVLALTAHNMDARLYRVTVSYDGEWGDNVWDHLKVDGPFPLKRREYRGRA
jgi:hypothetical protein